MGEEKNKVIDYFTNAFEMEEKEIIPSPDDRRMVFLHEKEKDIELCNLVLEDRADYEAYMEALEEQFDKEKKVFSAKQQKTMLELINSVNEAKDSYDRANENFDDIKLRNIKMKDLKDQLLSLDEQIEETMKKSDKNNTDEENEFKLDFLNERKNEAILELNRLRNGENFEIEIEEALKNEFNEKKKELDEKREKYLKKIEEQKELIEEQKEKLKQLSIEKQQEKAEKLANRGESYKKNRHGEKWLEIEASINESESLITGETFKRAENRIISLQKEISDESVNILRQSIKEYQKQHVEPIMKLTDYIYNYARQGKPLTNEAVTNYIDSNMADVKKYMYKDYPDMETNPLGAINNPANQHKLLNNYQQSLRMEDICKYMSAKEIGYKNNLTDIAKKEINDLIKKDYIAEMIEYNQGTRDFMKPLDKDARIFFLYAEKASLISQPEEGKVLRTYDEAMTAATDKCRNSAEWFRSINAKTFSLIPDNWPVNNKTEKKDKTDKTDKNDEEEENDRDYEPDSKEWMNHRYDMLSSDFKVMAGCYNSIKAYGGNLDMVENDCKKMREAIVHIKQNVEQNRSSRQLYTHIGAMENLLFEIDIRRENYDKDREKENYFQNIEKTNNSDGLAGMDKTDIKNARENMLDDIMSLEKKQEALLFDERLVGKYEKEHFMNEIRLSVLKNKAEKLKDSMDSDRKLLDATKNELDNRSVDEKNFVKDEIRERNEYLKLLDDEMAEYLDFKIDEIKEAMKGDGEKLPQIDESALSKEQIDRIRLGITECDEMYISMKEMRERISRERESYLAKGDLVEGLVRKYNESSLEYDKCNKEIKALVERQKEILSSQKNHQNLDFDLSQLELENDNIYEKTAMRMQYENDIAEKNEEYSRLDAEEKNGEKGNLLQEQITALKDRLKEANDDIDRAYKSIQASKNQILHPFFSERPLSKEDMQKLEKLEKFQENVNNELTIEQLKDKRDVYEKATDTFHSHVKAKDIVGKKLSEIKSFLDQNAKKDDTELYTSMKNALEAAKDKVSSAKSMKDINDALQPLKAPTEQYIKERDSFFKFSTVGANRVVAAKNIKGVVDSFSDIYKDNENRINAISEKNEIIGKQFGYSKENKPTKRIDKSIKELLDNPGILDKAQKKRTMRLEKVREKYRKEIEKDIGLGKH